MPPSNPNQPVPRKDLLTQRAGEGSDLQLLWETMQRAGSAMSCGDALQAVVEASTIATGAEKGLARLDVFINGNGPRAFGANLPSEFLATLADASAGQGLVEPDGTQVREVAEDVRTAGTATDCTEAKTAGFVALHRVPLLSPAGERLGSLAVYYPTPHRPDNRETRLLDLYGRLAADAIVPFLLASRPSEGPEARTLLAAIVDSSDDAIISKNLDGIITSWNAGAERLFGYRAEEAVGRPVAMLIPEGRLDEEPKILSRIRRGERLDHYETVRRRKDGRLIEISLTVSPLRDSSGKVVGASKIARDITPRIHADNISRRLASIVESSDDAIISKDLNSVITTWNAGAERVFGYTAAEAIGKSVTMLIPDSQPDEEPGILARIRRGERIEHYETIRRHKNGHFIDVSLTVSPIRNAAGIVVGASKIARDISGQRQAAAELKRRERLYRAIGESIDFGIWVCDAEGRNIYTSDSLLKLLGVTQEQCAKFGWAAMLQPDEVDATLSAWQECVRTGSFWEREHHFKGADGKIHPVLARGVPIREDDGGIVYWAGINLDISKFKQSQENLQRQTRVLERMNGLSSSLVAQHDLEKIVQEVTDTGCAISGAQFGAFFYNVADQQGERYMLFSLSGAPREAFEQFGMPRNTAVFGPTFTGEGPVRMADVTQDPRYGKTAPHFGMPKGHPPVRSYLAVPVISRSGEVLGGLFFGHAQPGVFTAEAEDMLVAIAAQAAIAIDNANLYGALQRELAQHKQAETALRQSEQQLRLVTDTAIVFLAQCDRDHRLKFVNRPYAQRFGREPAELVGKRVRDVVGEETYRILSPHLDEALQGRRTEFEIEVPGKDGDVRWVRGVHEPEKNADGEVTGLVAVIIDITERKRSEREMELSRDQALAASRAKDDFLAALSHELRTPLNPVLLLASEAAGDPALPESVRADFETVRKNVELEARLIDDLLDLTRITRGKLSLTFAAHDLRAMLEDAIATIQPDRIQKEIDLTYDFQPGPCLVWGDAVRLQQVFWNVMKNAVKFTSEKGRVEVRSFCDRDGRRAVVEVRDTGIGMSAAELGRVFDAFVQGDHASATGSHRFGGLGLGLAISKKLIEAHQGSIRALSEGRDQGSCFVIELPLADSCSPAGLKTAVGGVDKTGMQAIHAATRTAGRILLVEDHEPTRIALSQLLARRNYNVVPAASIAEALERADQGEFSLLISDVGLPDGSGYDLMAELRRRKGLPGIALSGYGMDHDVGRSRAAGFKVHLTKPVAIQSLDQALSKALSPDARGGTDVGAG